MKKYYPLLLLLLIPVLLRAQGTWTAQAPLPASRINSYAFTLNGFGYTGGGMNTPTSALSDFWQYDPSANTWVQKAALPGGTRHSGVAASTGSRAFIGLGIGPNNTRPTDWWEYIAATDQWVQRASFPGTGRSNGMAFVVQGIIYVGGGQNGPSAFSDWYAYDPGTDTWTQKAAMPAGTRSAATFAIGNTGYVVAGTNGQPGGSTANTYAYNAATNTWTQKAAFGGGATAGLTGFETGGKGYAGTGSGSTPMSTWYEYDESTNSWSQVAAVPGDGRTTANSFVINGTGYVLGGWQSGAGITNQVWAYAPAVTSVSAGPAVATCSNASPQQLTGTPAGGTWSGTGVSSSGTFSPATAGTGTFTLTYTATLAGQPASATTTVTVNAVPVVTAPTVPDQCQMQSSIGLTGTPAGGTWSGSGITSAGTFSTSTAGTFTLVYSLTQNGCTGRDTMLLTVKPAPSAAFTYTGTSPAYTFSGPAGAAYYTWSFGDNNTSNLPNPSHTYASSGTYTVTLAVTGNNGCFANSSQVLSVMLSVAEKAEVPAWRLLPNPSTGQVWLELPVQLQTAGRLSVHNMLGQEVYQAMLTAAPVQEVRLNALVPGCYFVRVQANGSSTVKQLTIAK